MFSGGRSVPLLGAGRIRQNILLIITQYKLSKKSGGEVDSDSSGGVKYA